MPNKFQIIKKIVLSSFFLFFFFSLSSSHLAMADESGAMGNLDIINELFDAGGGYQEGSNYILHNSSLGQWVSGNAEHSINLGFWSTDGTNPDSNCLHPNLNNHIISTACVVSGTCTLSPTWRRSDNSLPTEFTRRSRFNLYQNYSCSGNILGYLGLNSCSSTGVGTCYELYNLQSISPHSISVNVSVCLPLFGSMNAYTQSNVLTWSGPTVSAYIPDPSNELTIFSSSGGTCSSSGSGNCFALSNEIPTYTYYDSPANCGETTCHLFNSGGDTIYANYTECTWENSLPIFELLNGHAFKDITEPTGTILTYRFNVDGDDLTMDYVLRWEGFDNQHNLFDTGLEDKSFDIDYKVIDASNPANETSWYHFHPHTSNYLEVAPNNDAFTTSVEDETLYADNSVIQSDPFELDNDIIVELISQGFSWSTLEDIFQFRIRILDQSGNILMDDSENVQFGALWFQGVDGEIYADGEIRCNISSFVEDPEEAYILKDDSIGIENPRGGIIASGTDIYNLNLATAAFSERGSELANLGWSIDPYTGGLNPKMSNIDYDYFMDALGGYEATVIADTNGDNAVVSTEIRTAITSDGVYVIDPNATIAGISSNINTITYNAVIFSRVPLHVTPNIDPAGEIAFIVDDEIIIYDQDPIDTNDDIINLTLFTDDVINTTDNNANYSDQLNILGNLIGMTQVNMNRIQDSSLENLKEPTEKVTLNPALYFTLGLDNNLLGVHKITWREE